MTDNPIFLVGLVAIFQILGAIAFGIALRIIWGRITEHVGSIGYAVFLSIWGILLGCMPLGFGLQANVPRWVLPTQFSIFVLVLIITIFFGQIILAWARRMFTINVALLIIGAIIIMAGLGGGLFALGEVGVIEAIVISIIFGIIGMGIFLLGLIGLFKKGEEYE